MISTVLIGLAALIQPTLTPASDIPTADDPFTFWSRVQGGQDAVQIAPDDAEEFEENELSPPRRLRRVYTVPAPGRHPFIFVRGYPQRFYVPAPILNKEQIAPGETISPGLARKIAIKMGAKYTKEELLRLQKLDEETPK